MRLSELPDFEAFDPEERAVDLCITLGGAPALLPSCPAALEPGHGWTMVPLMRARPLPGWLARLSVRLAVRLALSPGCVRLDLSPGCACLDRPARSLRRRRHGAAPGIAVLRGRPAAAGDFIRDGHAGVPDAFQRIHGALRCTLLCCALLRSAAHLATVLCCAALRSRCAVLALHSAVLVLCSPMEARCLLPAR